MQNKAAKSHRYQYQNRTHFDKEYTKSIIHLLSYASMYMTNL